MAEHLSARGVHVKRRSPWGVFLLTIVTLGVYYLFWYYQANRELRDYARASGGGALGGSPLLSLLAITVGWIVLIPPFISMYQTFGRIATAQRIAGIPGEASPLLGLLLFIALPIMFPLELAYAQIELNKVWDHERQAAVLV